MKIAAALSLLVALNLHAQVVASWERFSDSGKIAANGKPFDPALLCCASRHFTLGTKLCVTDIHNGLSVVVTVTDRPAKKYADRIDLSAAAFSKLNGLELGTCEVNVRALMARQ